MIQVLTLFIALVTYVAKGDEEQGWNKKKALHYYNYMLRQHTDLLEVKEKDDGTFGIFAKDKIKQYEEILELSYADILTSWDSYPRSYFFGDMVRADPDQRLMGRLLYEKYIKKFGILHDYYIKHMNPVWTEDHNSKWNDTQWDLLSERIGWRPWNITWRQKLDEFLKKTLYLNNQYKKDYEPPYPDEMITDSAFRDMYAIARSRSFPLTKWDWLTLRGIDPQNVPQDKKQEGLNEEINEPGAALIPFLDLIAREDYPLNSTYAVKEILNLTKPETKGLLERNNIAPNHVFSLNERFDNFRLYDQMVFETVYPFEIENFIRFHKSNGKIILFANRQYQMGEEVKYQRGRINNYESIFKSGYVSPRNHFEHFTLYVQPLALNLSQDHVDYCYEIECTIKDRPTYEFTFHRNQVNYKFVDFLRLVVSNMSYPGAPVNKTAMKRVRDRDEFMNPWMEILTWKFMMWQVDSSPSFFSPLRTDVTDLKALDANGTSTADLQYRVIQLGILQKEIVYLHVNYAIGRFIKTHHNKIMRKEVKDRIMKMVYEPHEQRHEMMRIKYYED